MKKILTITAALLLTLAPTTALSGFPSAKFAAQVKDLTIIPETSYATWTPVLGTAIKTPEKKDLLIGVSFETGLYTQTKVKGKRGDSDSATASAMIKVRVLIDGISAWPPQVVYDRRTQMLNAVLGGVIESCQDLNADGVINVALECFVTDEEIELILDTMAAHHFNFVAPNMSTGVHQLVVEVMITSSSVSDAAAMATVGRGSLSVEEVRATNTEYGIDLQ